MPSPTGIPPEWPHGVPSQKVCTSGPKGLQNPVFRPLFALHWVRFLLPLLGSFLDHLLQRVLSNPLLQACNPSHSKGPKMAMLIPGSWPSTCHQIGYPKWTPSGPHLRPIHFDLNTVRTWSSPG